MTPKNGGGCRLFADRPPPLGGCRPMGSRRSGLRDGGHRLGVFPKAMPAMIVFWMLEVPSTTWYDLASRK
ncbi:MAG: hypothetical protein Kow0092_10990 [Deferrisomatales bacterium]